MIYIKSYFRRLRIKSSFYFSLVPSFLYLLLTGDFQQSVSLLAILTIFQYALGYFINQFDRKFASTGIDCVLCGAENCTLLYPRRASGAVKTKGDFACSSFDHGNYSNIYYCAYCKNGFLEHLATKGDGSDVEEGLALYQDVVDHEYIKNIEARYLTNNKIVHTHGSYFRDKDVLEIGSYYGAFLEEVRKVAKSYTGVEPSRHACQYVKGKYPEVDVFNGHTEELKNLENFKEKKFDTIVLFDVIEHVPNPIKTLRELNYFLREGGTIIFSTINIESTFSIAMGPKWPWFMDMHYYYFSDRGYVDMLHRSGYTLKKHLHFPYYVYFSYLLRKVLSLIWGGSSYQFFEGKFLFPVKIKLGDTVMIIGKKE